MRVAGWRVLVGIGALWASVSGAGGRLRVEVDALHEKGGRLAWALFSKADGFPSRHEDADQRGSIEIPSGASSLSFSIDGVGEGDWALALFQDFDGDARLKKNFLGIPREPIGFSGNPRVRFGPPSFEAARFRVGAEPQIEISVRMIRE
jgi:uncharacterized protein (DUF2141 family)